MRINDDMEKTLAVRSSEIEWVPSPAAGVDRRMLFRIGGEVARATSIVRYAPGSAFSSHTHSGGEEILVLEGTFQDEHGDYTAGTYFRNPPGTSHAPAAADGCTIFVRLWQFRQGDEQQIVRRPGEGKPSVPWTGAADARVLFDDEHEQVRLDSFTPGPIYIDARRGLEFLIVSGSLSFEGADLDAQSWGRIPAGRSMHAVVGREGVTVWLKEAPLIHEDVLSLPD